MRVAQQYCRRKNRLGEVIPHLVCFGFKLFALVSHRAFLSYQVLVSLSERERKGREGEGRNKGKERVVGFLLVKIVILQNRSLSP
jgi:hypothetical protein